MLYIQHDDTQDLPKKLRSSWRRKYFTKINNKINQGWKWGSWSISIWDIYGLFSPTHRSVWDGKHCQEFGGTQEIRFALKQKTKRVKQLRIILQILLWQSILRRNSRYKWPLTTDRFWWSKGDVYLVCSVRGSCWKTDLGQTSLNSCLQGRGGSVYVLFFFIIKLLVWTQVTER